jgi:hypothetical protein
VSDQAGAFALGLRYKSNNFTHIRSECQLENDCVIK